MKKKPKITGGQYYRIDDHKAFCVRMIQDGDTVAFEVEQLISTDIIPPSDKKVRFIASNMKLGLCVDEFKILLSKGYELYKAYRDEQVS